MFLESPFHAPIRNSRRPTLLPYDASAGRGGETNDLSNAQPRRRSHAEQSQCIADGFRSPADYDPPSDGGV